jgi:hypothetical protein
VEAAIFFLGFEDRALKEYIMFSRKRILSRVWKFAGFGALLLALFVAPLVIGCSNPSNGGESEIHDGPPPVGKWVASSDYFNITNATVTYVSTWTGSDVIDWAGNIRKVTYFDNSETSGVIIIEYIAGQEQIYYDPSDSSYYGDPDHIVPRQGNFEGVYFANRTSTSIELSSAVNPDYSPCETATLQEAINKFTLDAVDDFVTYSPTYAKQ